MPHDAGAPAGAGLMDVGTLRYGVAGELEGSTDRGGCPGPGGAVVTLPLPAPRW